MKWEKEFDVRKGYNTEVLKLQKSELVILKKAVMPQLKKARAKYEKYRAIHDSGDATEKEQDMLFDSMDELSVLESFCEQ